jgi:hypothetical protein
MPKPFKCLVKPCSTEAEKLVAGLKNNETNDIGIPLGL